jgi:plastocyanin
MKIVLILLGVAVCAVLGYVAVTQTGILSAFMSGTDSVEEGSHRMEDGTLMKNEEEKGNVELPRKDELADPNKTSVTLDPNARVVEVRGVNYSFDVSEIQVKKGETITINFESTDGFHDLVIDEFNVATKKVQPGTKTSVTFTADTVGTFEYYCSIGSHRAHGMSGKLVVTE